MQSPKLSVDDAASEIEGKESPKSEQEIFPFIRFDDFNTRSQC
jgi:hypothetical protein